MDTSTAFDDVMDSILQNGKLETSEQVDSKKATLKDELKNCMLSGDAAGVIAKRDELLKLPILKNSLLLKECREQLESIESRFADVASERAELISLRNKVNEELQPIIDAVNEKTTELQRLSFALSLNHDEERGLQIKRRETKSQILEITTTIENEVEKI